MRRRKSSLLLIRLLLSVLSRKRLLFNRLMDLIILKYALVLVSLVGFLWSLLKPCALSIAHFRGHSDHLHQILATIVLILLSTDLCLLILLISIYIIDSWHLSWQVLISGLRWMLWWSWEILSGKRRIHASSVIRKAKIILVFIDGIWWVVIYIALVVVASISIRPFNIFLSCYMFILTPVLVDSSLWLGII